MGQLLINGRVHSYRWASDVAFDGIRLEVLSEAGSVVFDISVGDDRDMTLNTFGSDVSADLIAAALVVARGRMEGR